MSHTCRDACLTGVETSAPLSLSLSLWLSLTRRLKRTVTLGRDMRQGGIRGCSSTQTLVGRFMEAFEGDGGFLHACRRGGGVGWTGQVVAVAVDH